MSILGLVAFFVVLEFCVERPKVIPGACQVVVGPLSCKWDEGCVAKVILVLFVGGGTSAVKTRGRTTLRKKRAYDCTLGYPGEDVAARLNPRRRI